jgi:ATP synthase protein I
VTGRDCYAPSAMAQQEPAHQEPLTGDPWHAFGYLVAGVAFYGVLGWLADQWIGTSFLVAVGILVGAGLGVYMTWSRFSIEPDAAGAAASKKKNATTQESQQ